MATKYKIPDSRLTRKSLLALLSVLREDRANLEAEIKRGWAVALRYSKRCDRLQSRIDKAKAAERNNRRMRKGK